MRFLPLFTFYFAAVLSSSVQKALLPGHNGHNDVVLIPGHTNACLCSNAETDIFDMERVGLVPNPPIP